MDVFVQENHIRTQTNVLSDKLNVTQNAKVYRRTYRRLFKRSRKRIIRYGLLATNIAVLAIVVGFVVNNPSSNQATSQNSLMNNDLDGVSLNPLDQLSSADIAVHVARLTSLPESPAVMQHADSVNAQMTITAADEKVVARPQVINTSTKTVKDIQVYVTQAGDTVSSIASKLGVSSDSIRWSNSLTGERLVAGKELIVPPSGVNGIVYTVKQGDTPESLAERYRTTKDQIVVFNDAEVGGLRVGSRIVIPDGIQPVTRSTGGVYSSGNFAWGGFAPVYSGNGYDYGYCTWWVAVRRAQVGMPIPSNLGNASTWKVLSQRAGMSVGNTPQQYAVIWTPPRDYYGHVGFVEEVYEDGRVRVSEMNVAGWNRISSKILTPEQAAIYSYIY